jgi:hypothetical protein
MWDGLICNMWINTGARALEKGCVPRIAPAYDTGVLKVYIDFHKVLGCVIFEPICHYRLGELARNDERPRRSWLTAGSFERSGKHGWPPNYNEVSKELTIVIMFA